MSESASFLHCGDIHLGNNQYNEPQRLQDFAAAFQQVTDYALQKKVDFVLLSGDFFHKRAINAETLGQAVELLSPLKQAGIPVVAIEGNHDKAFYQDRSSWLTFLNKQGLLYLLEPSFREGRLEMLPWREEERCGSILNLAGVRIYGLGYLGVTTAVRLGEALQYIDQSHDGYRILLLHTAINRLMGQDLGGIKKEILEPFQSRINYVALGHIHSRYDLDGWIHNPGALECCHLDEYTDGVEKGFYHVIVKEGQETIKYIPSHYRPVCLCTVYLEENINIADLYGILQSELSRLSPAVGSQIRVLLKGKLASNFFNLDLNVLTEKLKEDFAALYVEIVNETNLPIWESGIKTMSGMRREEIEKQVFKELLQQNVNWQGESLTKAVEAVVKVKEMVLNGSAEKELSELLLSYGEDLIELEHQQEDKRESEAESQQKFEQKREVENKLASEQIRELERAIEEKVIQGSAKDTVRETTKDVARDGSGEAV